MRYGLGSAANNIAMATSNRWAALSNADAQPGCVWEGQMESDQVVVSIDGNPYSLEKDGPYLTAVTDPKGGLTKMDYDLNGNLTEIKDAQGNLTRMTYDAMGHMTGTKDPLGHVSLFDYDTMGALSKVTDPLGRITQMTRDNLSRVTRTVDPKNKLTLFEYDVKSNLTQVIDALNGITRYTYTGGGCQSCGGAGELLASVTDAKNQQTRFNYDLQKRLIGVTNPLDQSKSFTYDKIGNLTSVTDAKGTTISFEYDVINRLTVKHLPEGDVNYTYDLAGNLLSAISPEAAVAMTYDALNRVVSSEQRSPLYATAVAISYAFDANGNRTQMTTPWGNYSYTYDSLNRLTSIANPDSKTINFTYDAAGRRTKMTLPNGTETTYAYDAAGQLTQLLSRRVSDNTALAFANYAYDLAGNRISMQDISGIHNYGYDDLHRLTSADHPAASAVEIKAEVFSYDAVGNRLADAVMINYQHNAANRLLENSSYTYTYDANGNRTGQTEKANNAHTTYVYDSDNQMIEARMPDGSVESYKYDDFGRRIEITYTKNSISATRRFIYDREDVLAILDGGNNLTALFTHNYGIDKPLIMKASDGNSYYYHTDSLGSITAISDSNAELVETVEYQAYGAPVIKDKQGVVHTHSTINNPYLYTAREYDFTTGRYFYRTRYYDPWSGRFHQEDSFTGWRNRPQTQNKYIYVEGRPTRFTDPLGLWSYDTGRIEESQDTTYKSPDPTLPANPSDPQIGPATLAGLGMFLDCMASRMGLPGMPSSWKGAIPTGMQAGGAYIQLKAWEHAGKRGLVCPKTSSIFRNPSVFPVSFKQAEWLVKWAPAVGLGMFDVDIIICLFEEIYYATK